MNINIITLGCSKNLVDSEYLLRQFQLNGHAVSHDQSGSDADVVILNTCGFILDAKQESIDTILDYIELKKQGGIRKLIVMGCLSERYRSQLIEELPEVDGFFGVWDHKEVIEAVGSTYMPDYATDRYTTTPSHYAYLKISEGCNRKCSFCAIPGIRGKQQSKSIQDLYQEAEKLAGNGVKEIILIAQDLTNYGVDINGKHLLPELLNKLSQIEKIHWIRLHYAYPTGFPMEVIEIMAKNPKVCKYLDIPVQHISERILTSMNRGHGREKLENLLTELRERVPDVAIRTTLLVGYPGETEAEFDELYLFAKDFKFDRLGVFPYSHEDDTPAAILKDDIAQELKEDRVSRIMEMQQEVSLKLNENKVGKVFDTIIDREEEDFFVGRTEFDSPEVDNEVLVEKNSNISIGSFYPIRITSADEFDLFGKIDQ